MPKISELTAASSVASTDLFPVEQSSATRSATRRATGAQVAAMGNARLGVKNVLDHGAACDGVTDDLVAFQAAVNAIPSGQFGIILVPRTAVLSAAVSNNGRNPIYQFMPGATIVGGIAAKLQWPARWGAWQARVPQDYSAGAPEAAYGDAAHSFSQHNRVGATQGYGRRFNLFSSAYGSDFDIADSVIGVWDRASGNDGGQNLTQWLVSISPTVGGGATRWGQFVAEWNVVNRHADHGWSKRRSTLNNWSGLMQIVPEANTFSQAGTSYDVLFGLMFGRSVGNKADGFPARMHNGILAEPNSITPQGRFIYASGRDSAVADTQVPHAFAEVDDQWKHGILTRRATLVSGVALGVGDDQRIALLDGADDVVSSVQFAADGTVVVTPASGKSLRIALPTSTAGLSAGDLWNDAGTVKVVS